MSYNPDSLESQKGALGEQIVKKQLEAEGCEVKKPDDTFPSGASIVDFACTVDGDTILYFIEVKVQAAYPYGVENAPCYSFLKSRIDAYIEYGERHDACVYLYVVDPTSGFIYAEILGNPGLDFEQMIDGRKYPFEQYSDALGGTCIYFHREQFTERFPIDADDLAALRKLFGIEDTPAEVPASIWVEVFAETDIDEITIVSEAKNMLDRLLGTYGKDILHRAITEGYRGHAELFGNAVWGGYEEAIEQLEAHLDKLCNAIQDEKSIPTPEPPKAAEVMEQVGSIAAGNVDIEVFRGGCGDTFLKFNSLYKALGYTGSVSLKLSPVGKIAVDNNVLTRIRPIGKQTIDAIKFTAAIENFLPRLFNVNRIASNVSPLLELLKREYADKYQALEQDKPQESLKALLEKIAVAVGVPKDDLSDAIFQLRQLNFEREQQHLKELLA